MTQQLVVDPKAGGSLTVKGTVQARSAGMYDVDFPQPGDDSTTNVAVTAKRRAGTTATTEVHPGASPAPRSARRP